MRLSTSINDKKYFKDRHSNLIRSLMRHIITAIYLFILFEAILRIAPILSRNLRFRDLSIIDVVLFSTVANFPDYLKYAFLCILGIAWIATQYSIWVAYLHVFYSYTGTNFNRLIVCFNSLLIALLACSLLFGFLDLCGAWSINTFDFFIASIAQYKISANHHSIAAYIILFAFLAILYIFLCINYFASRKFLYSVVVYTIIALCLTNLAVFILSEFDLIYSNNEIKLSLTYSGRIYSFIGSLAGCLLIFGSYMLTLWNRQPDGSVIAP